MRSNMVSDVVYFENFFSISRQHILVLDCFRPLIHEVTTVIINIKPSWSGVILVQVSASVFSSSAVECVTSFLPVKVSDSGVKSEHSPDVKVLMQ